MTTNEQLQALGRLVGTWTTEARHRLMPGEVVHGADTFEWLEGKQFLLWRSSCEHPAFPTGHSIIGFIDEDRVGDDGKVHPDASSKLSMQYFDSRGVFRIYAVSIDDEAWQFSRTAPGFSQRFRGTFADGGHTIHGVAQLCENGTDWVDDLTITYRRK